MGRKLILRIAKYLDNISDKAFEIALKKMEELESVVDKLEEAVEYGRRKEIRVYTVRCSILNKQLSGLFSIVDTLDSMLQKIIDEVRYG